jgi:hypothetical protein
MESKMKVYDIEPDEEYTEEYHSQMDERYQEYLDRLDEDKMKKKVDEEW